MRGSRGTSPPFLRGDIWWITYTLPNGRRMRESTQSTTKRVALQLLRERNDMIAQARLAAQNAKFVKALKGAKGNGKGI